MSATFVLSFASIFVSLDVIGAVPMYLSMTRSLGTYERRRVVNTSIGVALTVAILFMVLGQWIFRHLGIQLFDFKIAGGLVLLLISLADLLGGPSSIQNASGSTGIVPLAVPLITGPAVLTTLVLQAGISGYPITFLALVLNYALAWIVLRNCDALTKIMGRDGSVVLSKIAALLLTAIGIAMIRSGVFEAIAWKP